MTWSNRK